MNSFAYLCISLKLYLNLSLMPGPAKMDLEFMELLLSVLSDRQPHGNHLFSMLFDIFVSLIRLQETQLTGGTTHDGLNQMYLFSGLCILGPKLVVVWRRLEGVVFLEEACYWGPAMRFHKIPLH